MEAPPTNFPPGYLEESQQPAILGVTIFFQILTAVFFAARAYTRLALIKSFKVDDWILVAAWILSTAACANVYLQLGYGLGRHSAALPLSSVGPLALSGRTLGLTFIIIPCLARLAICLSYRHVFAVSPRTRVALTVVIVWVVIPNLVSFFLSIFYCTPISQIWTSDSMTVIMARPKCLAISPAYYFNGAATMLTDLALMALVAPAILRLNMPIQKKALGLVIANLGWLTLAATVVRLALSSRAILSVRSNPDMPWEASNIIIWSAVECNITLFCATAMGVAPLITKLLPPTFFNPSDVADKDKRKAPTIGSGSSPGSGGRQESYDSKETTGDLEN